MAGFVRDPVPAEGTPVDHVRPVGGQQAAHQRIEQDRSQDNLQSAEERGRYSGGELPHRLPPGEPEAAVRGDGQTSLTYRHVPCHLGRIDPFIDPRVGATTELTRCPGAEQHSVGEAVDPGYQVAQGLGHRHRPPTEITEAGGLGDQRQDTAVHVGRQGHREMHTTAQRPQGPDLDSRPVSGHQAWYQLGQGLGSQQFPHVPVGAAQEHAVIAAEKVGHHGFLLRDGEQRDDRGGGKARPFGPGRDLGQRAAGHRRIVQQQGQAAVAHHLPELRRPAWQQRRAGTGGADRHPPVSLPSQGGPGQRREVAAGGTDADHQQRTIGGGELGGEPADQLDDILRMLVEAAEAGRRAHHGRAQHASEDRQSPELVGCPVQFAPQRGRQLVRRAGADHQVGQGVGDHRDPGRPSARIAYGRRQQRRRRPRVQEEPSRFGQCRRHPGAVLVVQMPDESARTPPRALQTVLGSLDDPRGEEEGIQPVTAVGGGEQPGHEFGYVGVQICCFRRGSEGGRSLRITHGRTPEWAGTRTSETGAAPEPKDRGRGGSGLRGTHRLPRGAPEPWVRIYSRWICCAIRPI